MANLKSLSIVNSLKLPVGTTAQRPIAAVSGQIRYNSTLNTVEYYNGSSWILLYKVG